MFHFFGCMESTKKYMSSSMISRDNFCLGVIKLPIFFFKETEIIINHCIKGWKKKNKKQTKERRLRVQHRSGMFPYY
jgi:hypothetical protein